MAWTQAKTKKLGHLLIPIVLLLSCTLIFIDLPIMERLELKALDLLFWIRGEQKPQGHVVIVTIDEKTIRAWGRWPPPRARMADLVNHLSARGAKVILFDIIFSEKELVMETKGPGEEEVFSPGDLAFKEAIKRAGNVVLPFVLDVPTTYQTVSEFSKEIPETIQFSTYGRVKKGALLRDAPQAIGALPPLALFGDVAGALGHVYTLPDKDGVLRRDQLVVKYGEDYYPTMTLQATRLDLGLSEMEMELKMGEGVRLGKIEIPTDEIGRMLIDYFGKEKTFPYYSAADVVAGQTAPNLFDGKIALIGASAMATADSKVTPFSNNMGGFEKNATVIENILTDRFINRSESASGAVNLGFILFYGLLLWIGMPRLRALGGAILGGGLSITHLTLATILFSRYGIWIDVVYPAGAVFWTYVVYTGFQYFTEEKKAREIRKMFKSYVSPRVVEEMIKHPELARLGGTKQEVTVLFSDVRGFTNFCEARKERPAEVVAILNEYLGAMTDIVFEWDGTLDKFVGDAVMVFWGAPLPQEDHAWRAVGCGLQMLRRLSELHEKWKGEGKESIRIGIGINTGDAIVGNIGADKKKMDYTVIGDAVNLAARVESLTRKYPTDILITEMTYIQIKERLGQGDYSACKLDAVKVKGKEETIGIYDVAIGKSR